MKRRLAVACLAALAAGVFAVGTPEAKDEQAAAPAAAAQAVSGGGIIAFSTPADYEKATGRRIAEYREAPGLAKLVAEGKLPPLKERLPKDPIVVKPLDSTGKYGGELRASSLGPARGFDSASLRTQKLLGFSHDLRGIEPNIAAAWELSADSRVLTIRLREGLRWSDGDPFDADDVMFWYTDIIADKEVTPRPPVVFTAGGKLMALSKVDAHTVRAEFAGPYPSIVTVIALGDGGLWFAPKHYLSQYHIRYNPQAGELARSEGYDHWTKALLFHALDGMNNRDPKRPEMAPWTLKESTTTQKVYERNPYFWKVDTAGNQLPYIDRQLEVYYSDTEILNLKVMSGDVSFANQDLTLSQFPLYKRNEETGKYRTILMQQPLGSNLGFGFNPTHKDPVLRKLFNDIRFKQAMSLAINRDVINKNFFFGRGVPRQAVLPSTDGLYEEWMGSYFAQYDPDRANKLLDEIGLKWDAEHKYRLRPDGQTLAFTIHGTPVGVAPAESILELIREYWQAVGVKTDMQILERSLFAERGMANELDCAAFQFGGNGNEIRMITTSANLYRPPWGVLGIGYPWFTWYNTKGASGEEPPETIKQLFAAIDAWRMTVPGSPDYVKYGRQILKIHVENLYYIGTVGEVPAPSTFKAGLENTPKEGNMWIVTYNFASPHVPEQWYWK